MNRFDGVLGVQVQSLLDVLRRQQEARCREIVAAAEHKAKEAVQDTRRQLYERLRQTVAGLRQRRRHELLVARSHVESETRRAAFARYERIIEAAWPRLAEALERRWQDDDSRRAWCGMIVSEAAGTLAPEGWQVEHPADWRDADRDALVALLAEKGVAAPAFSTDDDITAGLRIRAGTACLDGTAAGLLAARHDVEALLLASWEQAEATDG